MAQLTALREALAQTINDAETGVYAYDLIPLTVPNCPAVVVRPNRAESDAMSRGNVAYRFELLCVAAKADNRHGQQVLDAMLATTGDKSVQAVFDADRTAGLTGVDVFCVGWSDYGVTTFAETEFITASIDCIVNTDGTT